MYLSFHCIAAGAQMLLVGMKAGKVRQVGEILRRADIAM
jgi:hypothetical protein